MPPTGTSMVEPRHAPLPGASKERHTRGAEGEHRFGEKDKGKSKRDRVLHGEGRAGRPGACAGRLRRRAPSMGPGDGQEARGGAGVRVYCRRAAMVWGASARGQAIRQQHGPPEP